MTNEIDFNADILDVRDLIERFEELEEDRKPWVAGWNMPGYMPECDPSFFESSDDALEFIQEAAKEEFREYGDDTGDDYQQEINAIDTWKADENGEFGHTSGKFHYWVSKAENDGMTAEEFEEFETLKSVLKSLAGYGGDHQWRGDWYPIALIRDNYFTEYAMDLLADIGDLPREIPSYIVIDQDATAENIKADYSTIEIDGTKYYYR